MAASGTLGCFKACVCVCVRRVDVAGCEYMYSSMATIVYSHSPSSFLFRHSKQTDTMASAGAGAFCDDEESDTYTEVRFSDFMRSTPSSGSDIVINLVKILSEAALAQRYLALTVMGDTGDELPGIRAGTVSARMSTSVLRKADVKSARVFLPGGIPDGETRVFACTFMANDVPGMSGSIPAWPTHMVTGGDDPIPCHMVIVEGAGAIPFDGEAYKPIPFASGSEFMRQLTDCPMALFPEQSRTRVTISPGARDPVMNWETPRRMASAFVNMASDYGFDASSAESNVRPSASSRKMLHTVTIPQKDLIALRANVRAAMAERQPFRLGGKVFLNIKVRGPDGAYTDAPVGTSVSLDMHLGFDWQEWVHTASLDDEETTPV